jgi:hypothetical protein
MKTRYVLRHSRGPLFPVLVSVCATTSLILSCGDDGTGGAGSTGGEGGKPTLATYDIQFNAVTVAPSEERTQCVVRRLGNDHPIHFNRLTNRMGKGSHHLFVYKTADTEEQPEPFDCDPFVSVLNPDKIALLMVSQTQGEDTLELPSGVGIALEKNQMIRIELHYINATTSNIDVSSTVSFEEMAESDFKDEANLFLFGNNEISLPPGMASTSGPHFIPVPSSLADAKFFGFSGHQHKLGTGVSVATATSDGMEAEVVYDPENFLYSEPPIEYYDPPITIPSGGGFRLACRWNNTSTNTVTIGESANDEMCLFYGYYYPSRGPVTCAHTGITEDFCCPGHPICSML